MAVRAPLEITRIRSDPGAPRSAPHVQPPSPPTRMDRSQDPLQHSSPFEHTVPAGPQVHNPSVPHWPLQHWASSVPGCPWTHGNPLLTQKQMLPQTPHGHSAALPSC